MKTLAAFNRAFEAHMLVARLETMAALPEMVVTFAAMLLSTARSSVPPARLRVFAAKPSAWVLAATSVPAERMVPPL